MQTNTLSIFSVVLGAHERGYDLSVQYERAQLCVNVMVGSPKQSFPRIVLLFVSVALEHHLLVSYLLPSLLLPSLLLLRPLAPLRPLRPPLSPGWRTRCLGLPAGSS